MFALKKCVQRLFVGNQLPQANFVDAARRAIHKRTLPFERNNDKIYPIQSLNEERRPAFVCYAKSNIKYSPKNMWYVANLVRGMSIDEALNQISFVLKKGGAFVKQALLEAQKMAVEEHNVEFKSNLWVSESFTTKGTMIKGVRRHARKRVGEVRYMYCNYFLTLEEGKPPENYYHYRAPKSKEELLQEYKEKLRKRKIINGL